MQQAQQQQDTEGKTRGIYWEEENWERGGKKENVFLMSKTRSITSGLKSAARDCLLLLLRLCGYCSTVKTIFGSTS